MIDLNAFALEAERIGASDLHFQTGFPPSLRVHGEVLDIKYDKITAEDINTLKDTFLDEKRIQALEEKTFNVDVSYSVENQCRLRVNFAKCLEGYKVVCRIIPNGIPTIDKFGMPNVFKTIAEKSSGMIIVAGTTGSGKSTTIAAMIEHINLQKRDHIITIEDPIEFVHTPKKCIFTRREIGSHVESFAHGLRSSMREDPDVILVGEMRDQESIRYGIQAAETGHLVFSTLHSRTCEDVPERIVSTFPLTEQDQVRARISETGLAFIAQVLVRTKGGKGRAAAFEILILTPGARNMIREAKSFNLDNVMQTNSRIGMTTMTKSLIDLYKLGKISSETLLENAPNTDRAQRYILEHIDPSIIPSF